ncbi:hypothetical protein [Lysobacter enzymogenes]|uniref:hypothetical protein n=1 Tax=Lysobacter enzymogenes TaxID=69 RepID=UPI001A96D129|nr:hypothetical protein [Lysobacter enzymogenes]QQP95120.1 hypothetical protein JHW38_18010 [Lysobacter enzymogenes]
MKDIYNLATALDGSPDLVRDTQALTLDQSKPGMGLKGTWGLFGSPQWWKSVRTGAIPRKSVSGVVTAVFEAGQDRSGSPNSFTLLTERGEEVSESMYSDTPDAMREFQVGKSVEIEYLFDELKERAPDGAPTYLDIVLRVSIED